MEAAHELADLLERERELGLRRVDQLRHLGRIGLEAALDQVQMERDGHEPLLGAVVQVALDAAPLGVAGGDDPRAGVGQVAHRAAQLGDVADDGNDLVGAGRERLAPRTRARRPGGCGGVYSTVASLPCSSDVRTHCISRSATSGGSSSCVVAPTTWSGGFASFDVSPPISR